MATSLQSLRLTVRSCARRRALHTTSPLLKNKIKGLRKVERFLGPQIRDGLARNSISPAEVEEAWEGEGEGEFEEMEDVTVSSKKYEKTFLNMGEPEPWENEHMPGDDHDDLPSAAHGELEQHREMRHYAKLAAWEMPLLAKLAKPFVPPTTQMPLRFRYTTYMGEQHPAEKKIVMEFSPADMPDLTDIQRNKLKKLAGVRYNPEKDIVKMSCEMFETQAQNKRYLGDLVGSLLREARDPTDTFEDIPLYVKHHNFKPKPRFPKEWAVTEERRLELAQYREQMILKDQQLESSGRLVDGIRQIDEVLSRPETANRFLPEMAMAGSKKKVSVRR